MSVSTIGIIGAGQMGAGVAQVAAQAGLNVMLNDISDEMCQRGHDLVERNLDRMIQRGRFKPEERDRIMRRVETTTNVDDLAACDFASARCILRASLWGATASPISWPELRWLELSELVNS